MKKSKALAKAAKAQEAQADRLAVIEGKLELIMEHLGIAWTEAEDVEVVADNGAVDDVPPDDGAVDDEQPADDIQSESPEEVVEETTSKRKK